MAVLIRSSLSVNFILVVKRMHELDKRRVVLCFAIFKARRESLAQREEMLTRGKQVNIREAVVPFALYVTCFNPILRNSLKQRRCCHKPYCFRPIADSPPPSQLTELIYFDASHQLLDGNVSKAKASGGEYVIPCFFFREVMTHGQVILGVTFLASIPLMRIFAALFQSSAEVAMGGAHHLAPHLRANRFSSSRSRVRVGISPVETVYSALA